MSRREMSVGIAALLWLLVPSTVCGADINWYTETYETPPPGNLAAILESPNALLYDFFGNRARARTYLPYVVVGSGDDAFYYGGNDFLSDYSPGNSTHYLLNGYSAGYGASGYAAPWSLGISFKDINAPNYTDPAVNSYVRTHVGGATFATAPGSNAPTGTVAMNGLTWNGAAWAVVWTYGVGLGGGTAALTVPETAAAVDRIEIDNTVGLLGWYTMDNLVYEHDGAMTGEYRWYLSDTVTYYGSSGSTPEPWSVFLTGSALLTFGLRRRRR